MRRHYLPHGPSNGIDSYTSACGIVFIGDPDKAQDRVRRWRLYSGADKKEDVTCLACMRTRAFRGLPLSNEDKHKSDYERWCAR